MDKNLLVVTAIQGYAENHHLPEEEVFKLFSEHDIVSLVRDQYEALHTQPLEETVDFVEAVMARYEKA